MNEQNDGNGIKPRSYNFSLKIIVLADTLPNKRCAWIIMDQLLRAGTSIGANIVEARASSSRLEYKKFFEIALKSANETGYWLSILRDAKLTNEDKINPLLKEANELANMLGAAVIKLKRKNF